MIYDYLLLLPFAALSAYVIANSIKRREIKKRNDLTYMAATCSQEEWDYDPRLNTNGIG